MASGDSSGDYGGSEVWDRWKVAVTCAPGTHVDPCMLMGGLECAVRCKGPRGECQGPRVFCEDRRSQCFQGEEKLRAGGREKDGGRKDLT